MCLDDLLCEQKCLVMTDEVYISFIFQSMSPCDASDLSDESLGSGDQSDDGGMGGGDLGSGGQGDDLPLGFYVTFIILVYHYVS